MIENKLVLRGKIIRDSHSDLWDTVKLQQQNGLKIDLVSRFMEFSESFNGPFSLSYFISSEPMNEMELKVALVKHLSGALDASYDANGYAYSEYTQGTDYDSSLMIGGHDLLSELLSKQGRYLHLTLTVKTKD